MFIAQRTAKEFQSHDEYSKEPHESVQWNGHVGIDTLTTENINHETDSNQEPEPDSNLADMGPDIRGMTMCYNGAAKSHCVSERFEEDQQRLRGER